VEVDITQWDLEIMVLIIFLIILLITVLLVLLNILDMDLNTVLVKDLASEWVLVLDLVTDLDLGSDHLITEEEDIEIIKIGDLAQVQALVLLLDLDREEEIEGKEEER